VAIPLGDISRTGFSRATRRIAEPPLYIGRRRRRIPRPIGGRPALIKCVMIETLGAGGATFWVKDLDQNGQPIEDAYEVNAMSYDALDPTAMGVFDLSACDPALGPGSILRICRQRLWRTNGTDGSWVDAWWTCDSFFVTGCTE